ncbi:MAG: zinc-binding dehydrogenase, partial [Planctomycetaceae bacterium]
LTGRGAQVSLDALGSHETSVASIRCLAKRGRHVQVGLLVGDQARPPVPMELVVGRELEILGSHGLPAPAYPRLFALMRDGGLDPRRLVSDVVSLAEGADLLTRFDQFPHRGITVIEFPECAAAPEGSTPPIIGRA